MNKILKYISFFILITLITCIVSCSTFKTLEVINVEEVELIENNDSIVKMRFNSVIYNPNWLPFLANDVSFQVYKDSIYLGSGYIEDGLSLAKYDTSSVSIFFNFDKRQLHMMSELPDSLNLSIIGRADVSYMPSDYYFEFDFLVDLDEIIDFLSESLFNIENITIKDIKLKKINLKNVKFEVLFSALNDLNTELIIDKLDIAIYKTSEYKKIVGSSTLQEKILVKKDQEILFKKDVNLNALSLGTSILSNTLNNNNVFYLKAECEILLNENRIPFTILKKINYHPLTLEIEFE